MKLKEARILELTIINAPSLTDSQKSEGDLEIHSVTAEETIFGLQSQIGVDSASGLINSMVSMLRKCKTEHGRQSRAW